MLELDDDPVRGCFDLDHLRGIHRRIFGNIYEWAGEIRTVDISKGNMFCRCEYIVEQSAKLFKELKDEGYLKGLERDELIDRLAYYLGEINAVHPFREGNGRTQRKFIEQLSEEAGFPLNFDGTSNRAMIEASAFAFIGDYERMREIIRRSIS